MNKPNGCHCQINYFTQEWRQLCETTLLPTNYISVISRLGKTSTWTPRSARWLTKWRGSPSRPRRRLPRDVWNLVIFQTQLGRSTCLSGDTTVKALLVILTANGNQKFAMWAIFSQTVKEDPFWDHKQIGRMRLSYDDFCLLTQANTGRNQLQNCHNLSHSGLSV